MTKKTGWVEHISKDNLLAVASTNDDKIMVLLFIF